MKIAVAQINTVAGDFAATAQRMRDVATNAHDKGADLVVFPLATLTGPVPCEFFSHEGYVLDLCDTLEGLAGELPCAALIPIMASAGDIPYADVVLVKGGAIEPLRARMRDGSAPDGQVGEHVALGSVPDASASAETDGVLGALAGGLAGDLGMRAASPYFEERPIRFELDGKQLGVAFTYQDVNAVIDGNMQVDALIFVSAYAYAIDDNGSALGAALDENHFRVDARTLDAWFVAAGSVGGYGVQVFSGSSFALAPTGDLVASAAAFEDALMLVDIDKLPGTAAGDGKGSGSSFTAGPGQGMLGQGALWTDAQPFDMSEPWQGSQAGSLDKLLEGRAAALDKEASGRQGEPERAAGSAWQDEPPSESGVLEYEIYNRTLHLWEALSLGLHDFLHKQGKTDVALVVSDDLASQLLVVLACDSLGPTHVHALLGTGAESSARELAGKLGVNVVVPELSADLLATASADPSLMADLTQMWLASVVRTRGAIALAEHDKTYLSLEIESNACRVAALLPFGDVYRTDLIELAHMRNTVSPLLSGDVFRRVAVPQIEGLDESEPTPAARLRRVDVTLTAYIEYERTLSDIAMRQGNPELCQRIVDCLLSHIPARLGGATCISASTRTVYELRVPAGFAWRDRWRSNEDRDRAREAAGRLFAAQSDENAQEQLISSLLEGVDPHEIEGSVEELLGIIRDMLNSGDAKMDVGPFGPMTWGSPFSEN